MNSTLPALSSEAWITSKKPSRHEELLDQAARQLNLRGVLRTSLSEIAAKLGVSRNALYYYVSSREDLLFQCYRRAAQITAARLAASIHRWLATLRSQNRTCCSVVSESCSR